MNTWENLLNPDEIADTVSYYNEKVGQSRHVDAATAVSVVSRAFNYYDYLDDEGRADAIRYDLQSFCEYATTAFNVEDELKFSDRYVGLLASGHPKSPKAKKDLVVEWISGAPELNLSGRNAIVAALSPDAHPETVRHAHVRLTVMAQSGLLSEQTMSLLEKALTS